MNRLRISKVYDVTRGKGYHVFEVDDFGNCVSVAHWYRTLKEAKFKQKLLKIDLKK